MGLDVNGTKFLLYARARGVSFDKTAMIGRQELLAERADLEKNLALYGLAVTKDEIDRVLAETVPYAEGFLSLLGATDIASFDASEYEGATVIHDLNTPIPELHKGRFSAVLDGGTLEHIFNFPIAIKNCMEMVADGGHFLAITPTNNHSGHGFYQFSPELFFRVFSEQNGFKLEHLMVFEETLNSPWYEITDPMKANERVTLINENPTMLLAIARKVKTVEIFSTSPQQSDYMALWEDGKAGNLLRRQENMLSKIRRAPASVLRRIKLKIGRKTGMLNSRPSHYKKVQFP